MKRPISVIMPCYNGEAYIRESLNSIACQGWDFEVIFVDDGSTDNSAKIVKEEYPYVRYYYQENSSPSRARNTGVSLASHEIIGFLDVDDVWEDRKTSLQMRTFEENPCLDVVGGLIHYWIMDDSQYRSALFATEPIEHILVSSVLVRKSAFNYLGGFDESMRTGEDFDWFMRLKESHLKYKVMDAIVMRYRIHEKGITAGESFIGLGVTGVLKRKLERKRRAEN